MKSLTIPSLVLAALSSTSLLASSGGPLKIVCGDLNRGYVDMDLSNAFKRDHVNEIALADYSRQGYDYIVAGRNCGVNSFTGSPEFEVLFLFGGKNLLKETVSFGPLTIFSGTIQLQGVNAATFRHDLLISGPEKRSLMDRTGTVTATLDTGRGVGKVGVIIRMKKN